MHFKYRCSDLPIHRATDARSVRWVRPGNATGSDCFALRETGVGNEILNAVSKEIEK